ncbi:hypothetical protein EMGBS15_08070, partial [Filimonas sp.]
DKTMVENLEKIKEFLLDLKKNINKTQVRKNESIRINTHQFVQHENHDGSGFCKGRRQEDRQSAAQG